MEFLYDFGLFLLKSLTVVAAILFVFGGIISTSQRAKMNRPRNKHQGEVVLTNLSEKYEDMVSNLKQDLVSEAEAKALAKAEKKSHKEKLKQDKQNAKVLAKSSPQDSDDTVDADKQHKRLFVLDFDGDIKASEVSNLREEISAVIALATKHDEVLLRLESPGGMVHSYGLAASQLKRLRDHGIPLTVAVDQVAASGGYMMAVVANKIVAAPFAIIGSIGVIAQIPNFNKLLRKMDVDYEQHTAGEYKRTLTVFGENTDADREKFKEELEDTHTLFKDFIAELRPELDIASVATGEHWYGQRALDKGLIDAIKTSDDLILEAVKDKEVFEVQFEIPKTFGEKIGVNMALSLDRFWSRVWTQNTIEK
ncbi:MAG: protease SohB [Enterobacterales bacterium]|nr:protease SohB [Enterobacterales bacterium]